VIDNQSDIKTATLDKTILKIKKAINTVIDGKKLA